VDPKLTTEDGHDLMATANTYGTGLSTALLDKLIPSVMNWKPLDVPGFVWISFRKYFVGKGGSFLTIRLIDGRTWRQY
jgi:hypothetical protein